MDIPGGGGDGMTRLKRIELMNRALIQAQPAFEQSWTAGKGLFALRTVQLMCGVKNNYGSNVLCSEIFQREKSFEKGTCILKKKCTTYKDLAANYATLISVFESLGWQKKAKLQLDAKMYQGSKWIDTFWFMLKKNNGDSDSSSSIKDFDHVFEALQHSTFETDVEFGMYVAHVDHDFECEMLIEIVFGDPKDKRMQRVEDGLKVYACAKCNQRFAKSDNTRNLCSRCKLVRYCSIECQRSHWSVGNDGSKGHKKYCKLMKEAAATAKKTAKA